MTNAYNKNWHSLDSAGKLFPAITKTRVSTVFRLSSELKQSISPEILQTSVNIALKTFPFFRVTIHRGLFWYYFEATENILQVSKETDFPCMLLRYKKNDTFPLRVLFNLNNIHIEFSHALTDGVGALSFFKFVISTYISLLKDFKENSHEVCSDFSFFKDSFLKYGNKSASPQQQIYRAYNFNFPLVEKGEYFYITGTIDSGQTKLLSATFECNITHFLLSILFESIQEYLFMSNQQQNKLPVKIFVPVNLRTIFPSKTLSNFFVNISPELNFSNGKFSRKEIITYIKSYMTIALMKNNLLSTISTYAHSQTSLAIRLIPLFFKNVFLYSAYTLFAEKSNTTSFSNLGVVAFPENISAEIQNIFFVPPPGIRNQIKVGVVTFKNNTNITFGKLTKNTTIESTFFSLLRKEKLKLKITTNLNNFEN